MKSIFGCAVLLLFAVNAAAATGVLVAPNDCSAGPWTELPDGQASVSGVGVFGGGILQVYKLAADGVTPIAVPNAFWSSDDGGGLFFGGGEQICVGLLANPAPVNPSITWEVNPMLFHDPASNRYNFRY